MFNYRYKKVLLAVLTAGMLGLGGCDAGFEEMNIDPNKPVAVPAHNLLTQAQLSLNQHFWGTSANAEFSMLMVQHFAQNEYAEESRYTYNTSSFNVLWNRAYTGAADNNGGGLNDLRVAANLVQNDPNISEEIRKNRLAVLEIMEVWAWHNLTDIFGAIPYFEALSDEPSPAYDSQEAIYADLISRLDAAVAGITPGIDSFSAGENIYGGDVQKWKKLANSLKLRIAMRMSDVAPGVAGPAAKAAYEAGVITDAADAALYTFNSQAALANPLYINKEIDKRDDYSVSKTLLDVMAANNDPRIPAYADPNISGEYVGMPYGLTDAEAFGLQGSTSRPNSALRLQQSEAIIVGPAEMYFLLAEAAQKGFISGSAAEFYEQALEASMDQWGVEEEKAEAYIEAHPYDAANWKQLLGEQKWVALYMQGLQAYAEWRRFDYPVLPFPAAADPSVKSVPVRAFYPADEEGTNGESLKAAGPNDLTTRLWWDVN